MKVTNPETRFVTIENASPLTDAYLERLQEMRRFFLVRLRSEAEADDLVQELYLKVSGLPANEDIRNPGAYLYRLAANLMLDRLRHQRRVLARDDAWRTTHHLTSPREDIADIPNAEAVVAGRQRLDKVLAALSTLPTKTQAVFRRHKFDGIGHAQIAIEFGISRSAVEKHMIDALRHLITKVGR
jgi:RNA polymerase sigma factor (sigma-70 family)